MFALTNKPDMGARLYSGLIALASEPGRGTNVMRLIQHMAGVLVETYLVFDTPEQSMQASFQKLAKLLTVAPVAGPLGRAALPPGHVMDYETEKGREAARQFFVGWLDCAHGFHDLFLTILHNLMVTWEEDGLPRAESFRLLVECTMRAMTYEVAAQELCDLVIEKKIAQDRWSLADCVAALSAVAGHRLALSLQADVCHVFKGADLPENLDKIVYVMTQEAVRLGVPAGTDWRFGLAANDMPVNPPVDLIGAVEPYCLGFFRAVGVSSQYDQAVCCAKAAGRMLAVAAGGETPEMEPAIAKPLAMMAITETYKSVCMDHQMMTC